MYILVVEDDHLQAERICARLKKEFPGETVKLIETEFEFCFQLDDIACDPPDIVVMDVMLRWTDPSPDQVKRPDEVEKEGHYRAGIRCKELLAEHDKTKDIPVILYTFLEQTDLGLELQDSPESTIFLRKDIEIAPLVRLIRGLTGR